MAYTQEQEKPLEKKIVNTRTVDCGGKTVNCNDNSKDECCNNNEVGVTGAVNLTVNVGSNNADNYVNDMPYNFNMESPVIQPHVIQPINQNPYVIEPTIVNQPFVTPTIVNPTMVQPMVQQPIVYENQYQNTVNYEGRIVQDEKGNLYILPEEDYPIVDLPIVQQSTVEIPKQTNSVAPTGKTKFNVMEMFGLKRSAVPCIETFYPEFL